MVCTIFACVLVFAWNLKLSDFHSSGSVHMVLRPAGINLFLCFWIKICDMIPIGIIDPYLKSLFNRFRGRRIDQKLIINLESKVFATWKINEILILPKEAFNGYGSIFGVNKA